MLLRESTAYLLANTGCAMSAAASSCIAGIACEYVSSVIAMVALLRRDVCPVVLTVPQRVR